MKYLLILFLLMLASCSKEENKKTPPAKNTQEVTENKTVPEKKSLPKPTMDIFAAIDVDNVEEIKKNIEFDKSCLDIKDPKKKFHYPLHYASINGKIDSVKVIAEYEDVNRRNKPKVGSVALIYAARKGHYEIVKYLVDKGADVNIIFGEIKNGKKINSGYTALWAACVDDHHKIVELLLKSGADHSIICKEDYDPQTAYDKAIENDSKISKSWLLKYRAKKSADLIKK